METLSLRCSNCGAPLQADASARQLSCGHCGVRLRVVGQGGEWFTEVLEELRADQRALRSQVDAIRIQREIAQLDRQWESVARRRGWGSRRGGAPMSPVRVRKGLQLAIALIVALGVVAFWLIGRRAGAHGVDEQARWGVLSAVVLVAIAIAFTLRATGSYQKAYELCQQRRRHLLQLLERVRGD
ncbi:MAG: hypothetical protein IPM29_08000 [Planctomycetes bacterium]|nr:hypothetical protein [Planctomycetota bacterium]